MSVGKRIKKVLLQKILPIPVTGCDAEYSMIVSVGNEGESPPTPRLLSLAMAAIQGAQQMTLEDVRANRRYPLRELSAWPGSTYRLLAGLVMAMQPRLVIEIGTAGGISALAIKRALPANGQLVTFDVIDWRAAHQPVLEERDFADQRLVPYVADVSQSQTFETYRPLFEQADVIFLDAAKDGSLEQRLLDLFASVTFQRSPILMLDDIRVWNMLKVWRDIPYPKLDLTSFGHWRGTGLVDWRDSVAADSRP